MDLNQWIKRPYTIKPLSGPVDYVAAAIASCGVGFFPTASGTFASLCAVIAWLPLSQCTLPHRIEAILIASILGVWASGRTEKNWGHDPSQTVIDEVAGQWITLLLVPRHPVLFAAGFLLFRLFDITKPPPIRRLEKLSGGLGIMADDWLAGLFGAVILALFQWFGVFSWNW